MTTPFVCSFVCRDNAGIRGCYSINQTVVAGGLARVTAALTQVVPGKKLRRGDLTGLLVFGTKRGAHRRGGVTVRLGYNGVISLKKDGTPVATRIYAPVWLEARVWGYTRLAVVATTLL